MRYPILVRAGRETVSLALECDAAFPVATAIELLAAAAGFGDRLGPDCRLDGAAPRLGASVATGLAAGTVVDLDGLACSQVSSPLELWVIAGPSAGRRLALPVGDSSVGRAHSCDLVLDDPATSAHHATFHVESDGFVAVFDAASQNGTFVDGRRAGPLGHGETPPVTRDPTSEVLIDDQIAIGSSVLLLASSHQRIVAANPGLRTAAGTRSFNRPPRLTKQRAVAPLKVPQARPSAKATVRFSMAALVSPLLIGAMMAALFGPKMALFALMSPVLLGMNVLEDRRRVRRRRATGLADLTEELTTFTADLTECWSVVRERKLQRNPTLAELALRASRPAMSLWERRCTHDDAFSLTIAWGRAPAELPVRPGTGDPAAGAAELLHEFREFFDVPIPVTLADGSCVGLVGPAPAVRAVARALLLQAAVLHGPVDLRIGLLCDPLRAPGWDFLAWLPHIASTDGDPAWLLGVEPGSVDAVLAHLSSAPRGGPLHLLVVDDPALLAQRTTVLRSLLNTASKPRPTDDANSSSTQERGATHPRLSSIVLAERIDQLPANCTTVAIVHDNPATIEIRDAATGAVTADALAVGAPLDVAEEIAVSLARWEDSDLRDATTDLPTEVALLSLLGIGGDMADGHAQSLADAIGTRWHTVGHGQRTLRATIGQGEQGPLTIDLVSDGPHALIAGTTGSGKSELLRTLVCGLAASYAPTVLNFVLIDYKGGSAFADAAHLPHTVGMVTDLDASLGERALACLEAELRHREHLFADAGCEDLLAYADRNRGLNNHPNAEGPPLPRLVVIIDEFATMAKELPDFLASLVGIAQRGRSLGVHLILATQRPTGAVNDNIRANTNMRIALRVQDTSDSVDVIGVGTAASLSRRTPGRGYVRLGPTEVHAFQAAVVTRSPEYRETDRATVRHLDVSALAVPDAGLANTPTAGSTDLSLLVDACALAAERRGVAPQRRPWPDPLPTMLTHADLAGTTPHPRRDDVPNPLQHLVIGRCDRPEQQDQPRFALDLTRGHVALFGMHGSGTSTAMLSIAHAIVQGASAGAAHLYAIDYGTQALAALSQLPHTGAVVAASDTLRQERLVRRLSDELDGRRECGREAAGPSIVVFIDNYPSLRAAFDDVAGMAFVDRLHRVFADGAAHGIHFVVSADRPQGIPLGVAASFSQKLLFRLVDPFDYGQCGARSGPAAACPGRAITVDADGIGPEAQIVFTTAEELGALAAGHNKHRPEVALHERPAPIRILPAAIGWHELAALARGISGDGLVLPFLIGDTRLDAVGFVLGESDNALVAGPPKSGKSTALLAVANTMQQCYPDVRLQVVAPRRSPLRNQELGPQFETLAECASAFVDGPTCVLIDDADLLDDPGGAFAGLLSRRRRPDLWVIAAGRADLLRSNYGHWTVPIRRSRQGLALRPQLDLDGDLWATSLPRRASGRFGPGRGYLVADGYTQLAQVALPLPLPLPSP